MPKPQELAVLTIDGKLYQDWETVMVRHAKVETPYYYFRFTCSEGMPLAQNWAALRIKPGNYCEITLAGQPAFSGIVHTRQVYYDGRRHHIEIQGTSDVLSLSYASVVHKTMEQNKVTYEKYVRALLKPFPNIKFTVEGGKLPDKEFPRISIAPGTSVMEAIEIPLRALGNIKLTSNIRGDLVAVVGPNGDSDTVTEGQDILEGKEIIFQPGFAHGTYGMGETPPSDKKWGTKATHENFSKGGASTPDAKNSFVPAVLPLEMPAYFKEQLSGRVSADVAWQNDDWVRVFITVQGWLKRNGKLWDRNQNLRVVSPMLIMDGSLNLEMMSVTFSQDNRGGSRTILEACNAAAKAAYSPAGPS